LQEAERVEIGVDLEIASQDVFEKDFINNYSKMLIK
jgi:hypothetical protein